MTPVSTSSLSQLLVIDANNVRSVRQVAHIEGSRIAGIAWSPDGKVLALASTNGISLYSVASAALFRSLGTDQAINVAFGPNGAILASSGTISSGNVVRLWNPETGSLLNTLKGDNLITCLSFSPKGDVLAAGEGDDLNGIPGAIQLWDVATGNQLAKLEAGKQMVTSIAFSPNGEMLASSSKDRVIRLWNLKAKTLQSALQGNTDLVGNVTFSPNGTLLAFGDIDEYMHGNIRLWDVVKGVEYPKLQTEEGEITSLSFCSEGNLLASGAYDGRLRLWNIPTGRQIIALDAHPHGETIVVFSPDGTVLASVGADDIVRLWGVSR
jgi:tricorn protease-like protein